MSVSYRLATVEICDQEIAWEVLGLTLEQVNILHLRLYSTFQVLSFLAKSYRTHDCYCKNLNNWTVCYVVGLSSPSMVKNFFLFLLSQRGERGRVFAVFFAPFPEKGIPDYIAHRPIIQVFTGIPGRYIEESCHFREYRKSNNLSYRGCSPSPRHRPLVLVRAVLGNSMTGNMRVYRLDDVGDFSTFERNGWEKERKAANHSYPAHIVGEEKHQDSFFLQFNRSAPINTPLSLSRMIVPP